MTTTPTTHVKSASTRKLWFKEYAIHILSTAQFICKMADVKDAKLTLCSQMKQAYNVFLSIASIHLLPAIVNINVLVAGGPIIRKQKYANVILGLIALSFDSSSSLSSS